MAARFTENLVSLMILGLLRAPQSFNNTHALLIFLTENGGAVYRKSCIINDTRTAPCSALPQSFNNTHALLIFLRKMAARAYCWRIERESPHPQASLWWGLLSLYSCIITSFPCLGHPFLPVLQWQLL